ncbi:MAG TPA: NUDIX hydrolase [Ktedonobacteraceae bacterium]|nr:NUDIX hydrolase [Ktedonobacteraceae bacterium]
MFYRFVKKLFSLSVNIFNFLLAGNLPPFVGVRVITEEQGRYLVIESPKDHFTFPGGFVRWREHPAQAAQREGKEETGLNLHISDVVGYYSCISTNFRSASALDIVFHGEILGGELLSSVEGKPNWLDESEVLTKMGPLYGRMLDDYLHHQCTARAKLEAVRLVEQKVVN